MFSDNVRVSDSGAIYLDRKATYLWGEEKSVVETRGWVKMLLRERGKIVPGSFREGHNVWTNTGREYLAMLTSYQPDGSTPFRSDRIGYIGIGTGYQTEDANVISLVHPVSYSGSNFLAPVDHTATSFPLTPSRTTVRYTYLFQEDQITTTGISSVLISELGLFTDGSQANFAQGGRDASLSAAAVQSPVAYKSLTEPVEKTDGLQLQVEWEIRY